MYSRNVIRWKTQQVVISLEHARFDFIEPSSPQCQYTNTACIFIH